MRYVFLILVLIGSVTVNAQKWRFAQHGNNWFLKDYDGTDSMTIASLAGGGLSASDTGTMLSPYLRNNTASTTYLSQSNASSTYAPLASPVFTGTVTIPNGASLGTPASINLSNATFPTLNQNTTGSAAILTTARTINGVSFNGSANITVPSDIAVGTSGNVMISNGSVWTSAARYPQQVATADIVATASATSTTTLFTPTADGVYRISVYMKITTTGTSPVAGPVTITYTDADGSVAQSHTMLLQSNTGTVVTTTVNNSTTTGTVNGSMVVNAKSGVAIQYAIAVSGTFGAGRYTAHLVCERIK